MKPSDIKNSFPFNSIMRSCEAETVARNIAIILARNGNEFNLLSWDNYQEERIKDGNFSLREKNYFDKVIPYFESEEKARFFSSAWNL